MILLDTNAILWILAGELRVEPLLGLGDPLFLSPVSLLEIRYLVEVGRVRESSGHDRLLAAHALCRRWRLATGDEHLSEHLPQDRLLIL